MFDYPRIWARYRVDGTGEAWDTWHYDSDLEVFVRSRDGATLRRTAITERPYIRRTEAVVELDRLEAANA